MALTASRHASDAVLVVGLAARWRRSMRTSLRRWHSRAADLRVALTRAHELQAAAMPFARLRALAAGWRELLRSTRTEHRSSQSVLLARWRSRAQDDATLTPARVSVAKEEGVLRHRATLHHERVGFARAWSS